MHRFMLLSVAAFIIAHCFGGITCLQLPEASELQQPDDDFETQIKNLQRNVSDIWTYIYELRSAVSNHLTHLRQHQVELESSMHKMEHLHESELSPSGHHHSGEQHSHSGEQHSHSGEHSHGSDHSSHGSMEQHSHSGEQHSHSGEQHSHGGEHHSHGGDQHSHSGEHHSHSGDHGHHSHSYSHSHDHSKEDSHSHGGDHHHHDHGTDEKDTHDSDDLQTQQAVDPVAEPIVVPTTRQEHYHRHSHQSSRSGGMDLINERGLHHHHHQHHQGARRRNRTVELPRYSDYGQFDLAICKVQPNRAIPENQQQDVEGTVTLWQKKTGGPLNLHVRLHGFDVGGHHGHHQAVQQEEDNEAKQAVGHRHGFHIHTFGDLSNDCQSTGPHFNPKGVNHGGPHALVRHVGDLGNIECDDHGNTNILFSDSVASLRGQYSILGKSMVIHTSVDDLGLVGDAGSLSTGNAGSRIACCVIQKVDKIPLSQYKAMKTATQHQNR